MRLTPTADGGEAPPKLKLTEVGDCNTMKQRYIIDVLTENSVINRQGILDINKVMEQINRDKGENYTEENYVYYVRGKFTKVIPQNTDIEWKLPFKLVQIKSDADVRGDNQRRILKSLKLAEIDEGGDINITEINRQVMEESTSSGSQNSNIWQTIGEFAIVVPEKRIDDYRAESTSHSNDKEHRENSDDVKQGNTISGSESTEEDMSDNKYKIPEGTAEATIHLPSYREGYSDGYSDAMRDSQSN